MLVDRLWPRGVRKADAALDETAKELTPSTELRQAFHHGELDFDTFAARYRADLDDSDEPSAFVDRVKDEDVVVLLYGAADREHNHALVLRPPGRTFRLSPQLRFSSCGVDVLTTPIYCDGACVGYPEPHGECPGAVILLAR